MDGNRRDSGCRPFFCALCNPQLVRRKAGFYGRVTQMTNLSGGRRVFTDESHHNATCPVEGRFSRTFLKKLPTPPLHAGDDLHYEKKQGRAAVSKGDEKVRADADGEQD